MQQFSAADDEEAVARARKMVNGASEVETFDLWEGERRVVAPAKKKLRR